LILDNLKNLTVKGLAWNTGRKLSHTFSNIVITLILVRFLSPSDFGEVGMITVFSGFASVFLDFGLGNALIQKAKISQEQISTIFWLSILMGIFLALLFYILAPQLAAFYQIPRLEIISKVISINFILSAIGGIPRSLLIKEMKFKQLFQIDMTAFLISGIVAILLAHHGYGVWSLIQLILTQSLLMVLFIWLVRNWWPSLVFNLAGIKEFLSFGFNLTGNGILNYTARNFDNLLIGKVLGESALGIYSKAYSFLMLPLSNITNVFNQVLFPSFSTIQKDHKQISSMYLKAVAVIAMITFPLMMLVFITSENLVHLLFGKDWLEMIPLIKIFCFLGMLQSILGTTGSLFLSQNRTDLVFKFSIISKIILFAGLFFVVPYGLESVAYCWLIFSLTTGYFQIYLATNLIKLKLRKVFISLFPILLITMAATSLVWWVDDILMTNLSELPCILINTLLGVISYIAMMIIFKIDIFFFAYNLIKKRYLKYD
jgi:O-antigen/teichoic acid export membrane protein